MKSHIEITPLRCNICEKQFYVQWRMKKHISSHLEQSKFCHYYNNGKFCPYEELGCRFKHSDSRQCKYDKKCRIKLCQFKHKEETNGEMENLTENIANDIDKIIDIEDEVSKKEKFENMNEYDQFEVYQEICLNICWAGDHKCMDHIEDNALLGVKADKIRDDYNNCREEIFYCENECESLF